MPVHVHVLYGDYINIANVHTFVRTPVVNQLTKTKWDVEARVGDKVHSMTVDSHNHCYTV